MRVAVVGGGIGGLTAALSLARSGHEVSVFERASRFGEVGAGIQISPNGRRVLHDLGLRDAFAEIAVESQRIVLRRWQDDSELAQTPLGEAFRQRYGAYHSNVARPDLVAVLEHAVGSLPNVEVRLGARVAAASPVGGADGRPLLQLADGSSFEADVVVGADGIHSQVRDTVLGVHPSRFSGSVAYRALIPAERVAHLPLEVTNRVGPDAHVVTYFVGAGARWLNVVCIAPEAVWDVESWTEQGSADEMRERYVHWSPQLREVLAEVRDPVFRWALHDREPLPSWGTGGVTLLGDACHPMLPFMAQGACQAIEDAAVLTRWLDSGERVDLSLRGYEAERKPRTDRVQSLSWGNRLVFHMPDGDEQRARDEMMRAGSGVLGAMDWLYGWGMMGA
ncbi:MAG: FAD-dependent monooxygenase [Acidobacteria bacterium]|nr:FAD-dependent monooxygenase [Acidobacteriota bacterium]